MLSAGRSATPSATSNSRRGGSRRSARISNAAFPRRARHLLRASPGTRHVERKDAGRALMKEILTLVQLQQEGESTIAAIGGFDLEYSGERFGRDGYRYSTMLIRTGAEYEIELP